MSHFSIQLVALLSLTLLLPNTHGWGDDGHVIVCKIAQARLSKTAAEAVQKLLLKSAEKELSSKCSWADHVHHIYPWSSALHYANTPDAVCSYNNSNDYFLSRSQIVNLRLAQAGVRLAAILNRVFDTKLSSSM
ncbi:Endonuclease 2 [Vigna angularis]|uniref:Aspergillus nuclease S1 n=1 Tax=Phaseolus angularis TaxID=3914 RepID=A0A8T0JQ96_PHAAN|nr:Endonuclease 2 [Vigna angularis]